MARATAYSATTVLPAPVGAATRTLWPRSMAASASRWNGSSVKPGAVTGAARSARSRGSAPVPDDQSTDHDRDLVEDRHGDRQGEEADGIGARGDHGGHHEDDHHREPAELGQLLGADH